MVNRVLVHCCARVHKLQLISGQWVRMKDRTCTLAYYRYGTYFSFSSLCILCVSLLSNPSVTKASKTNDCINFLSPEMTIAFNQYYHLHCLTLFEKFEIFYIQKFGTFQFKLENFSYTISYIK